MAKLIDELKVVGCAMGVHEFRFFIYRHFEAKFQGVLKDEGLLIRPRLALIFCDEVRAEARCFDLPDHVILGTLLNVRKNGL